MARQQTPFLVALRLCLLSWTVASVTTVANAQAPLPPPPAAPAIPDFGLIEFSDNTPVQLITSSRAKITVTPILQSDGTLQLVAVFFSLGTADKTIVTMAAKPGESITLGSTTTGFIKLAPILRPTVSGTSGTAGKITAYIVAGDVQITPKGGAQPHTLIRGEVFTEGTFIRTGPSANALLVFSNGATLKLLENTQVVITAYRQEPFDEQRLGTYLRLSQDPSKSTLQLDLRAGIIQGEAKQLNTAAGSMVSIDTPNGSTIAPNGVFTVDAHSNLSNLAPATTPSAQPPPSSPPTTTKPPTPSPPTVPRG